MVTDLKIRSITKKLHNAFFKIIGINHFKKTLNIYNHIAQNWNINAKLSNFHTKPCFPWLYISVFCALRYFLLIFVFLFCMLMLFFLLHLFAQMLRLEFYVNQVGFKRHHWSTSSWLTAPPQPVSWRGAVTSLQHASLAVDAQRSLVQVKMDYCQLGNIFPYQTPFMCPSFTAVRLPDDPLTLNV